MTSNKNNIDPLEAVGNLVSEVRALRKENETLRAQNAELTKETNRRAQVKAEWKKQYSQRWDQQRQAWIDHIESLEAALAKRKRQIENLTAEAETAMLPAPQADHYEYTGETKTTDTGETVYRIRSLIDRPALNVKAGDVGGWIGVNATLGAKAWVGDEAALFGSAELRDVAYMYDDAHVHGEANVLKGACVYGSAWIHGEAYVYDEARVGGNAHIHGEAHVSGKAMIGGDACVGGEAQINGNARVDGYVEIHGTPWIFGNAWVHGDAWVYGGARIHGNAVINTGFYKTGDITTTPTGGEHQ